MHLDVQLGTHQPPTPKTSQASAWRHWYIGHWTRKTEGSHAGLQKVEWLKNSLGKSGRFRTSGNTFWSWNQIPIWVILGLWVSVEDNVEDMELRHAYQNGAHSPNLKI